MVVFLLMNGYALAQNPLQVQTVPQFKGGGYNISCFGGNNGRINTQVTGGVPPYTYQWSNGAGSVNLTNASAGVYSVIVTDAQNNTTNAQVELYQPKAIVNNIYSAEYNGFKVSKEGASDGSLKMEIGGGNTPYTIQWSSGQTGQYLENLDAGNYAYTIMDMSGCVKTGSINMTQPGPFSANVSVIQHLSCRKGEKDGVAYASATGGQPPYKFIWDNGQFTDTANYLNEGKHIVKVYDANGAEDILTVNINRPDYLSVSLTPTIYSNSHNTSCADCCNGSISTTVAGGTAPFTYLWSNEQQTAQLGNLCEGYYSLRLLDNKGCITEASIFLSAPKANNWNLTGNTNSDPASQFIGTSDNKDLVFKTNNTETFRLGADGKARFANGFKVNAFANSTLEQDKFSIAAFNQFGEQIATNLLIQRTGTNGQAFSILQDQLADVGCLPGIAEAPYWAQSPNKLVTAPTQCQDNVKVGIGVANPTQKLEVNGSGRFYGNGHFYGNLFVNEKAIIGAHPTGDQWINNNGPTLYMNNTGNSTALYINALGKNDYSFIQQIKTDNPKAKAFNIDLNNQSAFTVYGNGTTVIGSSSVGNAINNSKLMVDGLIAAREVRVMLTNFPDYVFEDDYCLDELENVAEFIKTNKHLPGVLPAKEVKENGGFEIGAVQLMTLEKLEELYLHVIRLNERIKVLELENASFRK